MFNVQCSMFNVQCSMYLLARVVFLFVVCSSSRQTVGKKEESISEYSKEREREREEERGKMAQ